MCTEKNNMEVNGFVYVFIPEFQGSCLALMDILLPAYPVKLCDDSVKLPK